MNKCYSFTNKSVGAFSFDATHQYLYLYLFGYLEVVSKPLSTKLDMLFCLTNLVNGIAADVLTLIFQIITGHSIVDIWKLANLYRKNNKLKLLNRLISLLEID